MFSSSMRTIFTSAKNRPPIKAVNQLLTSKLGIRAAVIISVTALMKKPVAKTTIQPSGMAINNKRGRINRLTIPSSNAATVAMTYCEASAIELITIPGTTQAVINKDMVSINQTIKKRINELLKVVEDAEGDIQKANNRQ